MRPGGDDHPGRSEDRNEDPPASAAAGATGHGRQSVATSRKQRSRSGLTFAVVAALYLVLATILWWQAWSNHPSSTTLCACGDPALFLWFLEWPAYAIAHGHNPFYSNLLFYPGGINLLSNTSVLAIGIVLAPVTWLFGPIATLNVASTLSPALSALALFWLLRRWRVSVPAAFVGGLLYGFSPFMIASLAYGHLMTSFLVIPPLVVACLDEILVRQRKNSVVIGVLLGLLLVLEFFVSTEMLLITVVLAVVGTFAVAVFAALRRRELFVSHLGAAAKGLATAGVVSVLTLAYPAWYALAGRARLATPIWPGLPYRGGTNAAGFFHAFGPASDTRFETFGGHLGPSLPSPAYVGTGLVAVLVLGLVVWRRDLRLWFFAGLALLSSLVSLTVTRHGIWTPWREISHLPMMQNIIQGRFVVAVYLSAAVMLALILDHAHISLRNSSRGPKGGHVARHGSSNNGRPRASTAILPVLIPVALATVALWPIASAEASVVPLTMSTVRLPAWFAAGPPVDSGTALLVFPFPSGVETAMTWQAVSGFRFAQVGGGGPQSQPWRLDSGRAGYVLLQTLTFGFGPSPSPSLRNLDSVREALADWHVEVVVVPTDLSGSADQIGRSQSYATAFLTAALGEEPQLSHRAWVWKNLKALPPPLVVSRATLTYCAITPSIQAGLRLSVPQCVVREGRRV